MPKKKAVKPSPSAKVKAKHTSVVAKPKAKGRVSKPKLPPIPRKRVPTVEELGLSTVPDVPTIAVGTTTAVRKVGGTPGPPDASERYRSRHAAISKQKSDERRDIAPMPNCINWERRLATQYDLKLFCETYFPNVFYLGWSEDQLKCLHKAQTVCLEGGKFALAMPRGSGKTAISRSALTWATAFAHKRFPFFIGSNQRKAQQTLDALKTYWFASRLLLQDFPEIGYPIRKLENRNNLARGQMYYGNLTYVEWGADYIKYPCMLFPKEAAQPYLDHCPDFIRYLPEYDCYICKSAGIMIGTSGVDGSIRGEAEIHPITLEQPRPDIVLLDDVQKDQKADSPMVCEKIIRLIDGAITGLTAPGQHLSVLMPCTVIREGDVADTYLDTTKKPEYQGERCKMVTSWPAGINDWEITLDSPAGKHWNEYAELCRTSLRQHGDRRLANDYYIRHRTVMDEGFICSWQERYTKENRNPHNIELSPQQHAMNLRITAPDTFPSEFQNQGRRLYRLDNTMITAEQLREKTVNTERGHVQSDCHHLVAFIDVQDEANYFTVVGVSPDYDGIVTDYGTWPQVNIPYFTKNQISSWSMLTSEFFKKYPEQQNRATRTDSGRTRAPFEAKIYFGLDRTVNYLRNLRFIRDDVHKTIMQIQHIAIDTRWGQASDTIKRYIRESHSAGTGAGLLAYMGFSISPLQRQYEAYTEDKTMLFEHQKHPHIKECKWILKPTGDGLWVMHCDVDRQKDFLFSRLGAPPGTKGSLSMFKGEPELHEMFSDQVCKSEYPEPVEAKHLKKNKWILRDGIYDNEYLDCLTGCMALCSFAGASLKTTDQRTVRSSIKVTDKWRRADKGGRG